MKLNMYKWREDILKQPQRLAIPIMTHPGIDALGHTVRQAITDGAIHAAAVKYLASHYPTAAASVIMDLTVEAEAFGADILFAENEIATVVGHSLDGPEDIAALKVPSLRAGRVPQYLKANILASRSILDRPLLSGCIGPFSLAGRLCDMSEFMMLTVSEPEAAHQLLEKCTRFIWQYCAALKAAGANGVVMAEPAAGLMSNEACIEFSSNYVRRIVEALQDETFIIVLHNCGNQGHCTDAMVRTGAHALHLGNKCDLAEVAAEVPDDILVMGNLDPVGDFKQATPDEMYQRTTDLLQRTARFPHVVMSSGCDTPPHTPLTNVDAFFRAVADYNAAL